MAGAAPTDYVSPEDLAAQQLAAQQAQAPTPVDLAPGPPTPAVAPAPAAGGAPGVPGAPPAGTVFAQAPGAAGAPGAAVPGPLIPLAAGARPQPAAYVPTTQSAEVTSGTNYSPETQKALADYGQAAGDAYDETVKQKLAEAAKAAATFKAQGALQQFQQHEVQAQNAKNESARSEAWNALQNATAARQDALDKGIDPNRFSANQSTGSRIATFIALAASGFAAGVRGGPNQALEYLQQLKREDVDAQRANIAGKERAADAAQTTYGLMKQHGLDDSQALTATHLVEAQDLQRQLDAAFPDANPTGQLALDQMRMQNSKDIAQLRAQFDEKATSKVVEKRDSKFRPATTGGPDFAAIRKYAGDIMKADHEAGGNMTPQQALGLSYQVHVGRETDLATSDRIVKNKGQASPGARALIPKIQEGESNIDRLKRLRELSDTTVLSPGEQREAGTIIANLQKAGVEGLPAGDTMLSRFAGSSQAAVDAAMKDQQARVDRARKILQSGVGGTEDVAPEGFEEQ